MKWTCGVFTWLTTVNFKGVHFMKGCRSEGLHTASASEKATNPKFWCCSIGRVQECSASAWGGGSLESCASIAAKKWNVLWTKTLSTWGKFVSHCTGLHWDWWWKQDDLRLLVSSAIIGGQETSGSLTSSQLTLKLCVQHSNDLRFKTSWS